MSGAKELNFFWNKHPTITTQIVAKQQRLNQLESLDAELNKLAQKKIDLENMPLTSVKKMSKKDIEKEFSQEQLTNMISILKQTTKTKKDTKKRFTDIFSKLCEFIT